MNKNFFILMLTGIFVAVIARGARAAGYGSYVDLAGGAHTHAVTTSDFTNVSGNVPFFKVSGGFIMDSNLGGKDLLNVRMKLGGGSYVKYTREIGLKVSQMDVTAIFGFGVVKTKVVRFWLGPSLGVNIAWGKGSGMRYNLGPFNVTNQVNWTYTPTVGPNPYWIVISRNYGTLNYPLYAFGLTRDRVKRIFFGGGSLGFSLGVNINIGKHFSISVDSGIAYDSNSGSQSRTVYDAYLPSDYSRFSEKLFVHGWRIQGSVAAMYRVGK